MTVTASRKARKWHRCDGCTAGGEKIKPGDVYLEFVVFPGSDGHPGRPVGPFKGRECAKCATRYGRDHELDLQRMSAEQSHDVYLWAMRNGHG